MSAGGRRPMRADRTASTIQGLRPVRMGALSAIVFLTSIALAGCPPEGGTGDGGGSQNDGGVGPSSPGDDGSAPVLLDGSITADSGTPGDSGTTDAGGTTDDAAATVDAGPGHAICSQSWSVVTDDPNNPYSVPQVGARMLALDGSGNMVVATSFQGTVTVAGQTFQTFATGDSSLLVVKLDSTCKVLWARAFGAAQAGVEAAGVAVDATGNIVVGATHIGPPVDFGSGPVGSVTDGRPEAVVFKLGPDGTGLWSHGYLASPGSFLIPGYDVEVVDVAVDSRGNTVFATSRACPPRASCNPGTVDYGGGAVSFVWALVELDANGNFVFAADASFAGQSVYFAPHSLATGSAGRVWEAGFGDEFDIVAVDASGHQQGVQKVTGTGYVQSGMPAVRVDANDDVLAVAPSAGQLTDGGPLEDTLLYKFSGGSPSWTPPVAIPSLIGSASWEAWPGGRLAVDSSGRALVTTAFAGSTDFGAAGSLTSAGGIDAAILRFDAQGHLIGGERWGGAADDYPVDVVADAAGDAVVTGWSVPPASLDGGAGSANYAVFVAKLGW